MQMKVVQFHMERNIFLQNMNILCIIILLVIIFIQGAKTSQY